MMQGVLWAFVQLSFLLGQAYGFAASKKNAIYSSTNVNGIEGKLTSITRHIPIDEIPENSTCQWLKDGNTIEENGRFTYSEDRSTGKYSLEINSTQRNDEGTYKFACGDSTESSEIFLNVIGIPAEEYPNIELEKVSNNLIVIRCTTEKCFPTPELMFHDEEHVLYENATHFLINKTVPIASVNPNVTYICVLQVKGYYKRFKTKTGSQVTEYWNKTADESKVKATAGESTVKTTPISIPVKGSHTNIWLAFKIAIILLGTVAVGSCLVITFLRRKSLKNKTSGKTTSISLEIGVPI